MTEIDVEGFGTLDMHFVHSKSSQANAAPLLFVHGWPGSFAEVEKILPKLNEAGFHVVAPSLPGYGFSTYTVKEGFKHSQHAEALHKVMLKLGYDRYFVQGGDWGSLMVRSVALRYPEHVKALHCNMVGQLCLHPDVEIHGLTSDFSDANEQAFEYSGGSQIHTIRADLSGSNEMVFHNQH